MTMHLPFPEDPWCCRLLAPLRTKRSGIQLVYRPEQLFLGHHSFYRRLALGSFPSETRKLRRCGSHLILAVRQLGKLFLNKMVSASLRIFGNGSTTNPETTGIPQIVHLHNGKYVLHTESS
ncbi:rCG57971 [Rattus norvegicus]|uniref:RCG57971 n=1 Tax=Rattus norvegicus TaxID=10116 RepID=A6J4S6_RAT|nr:rCG57971 [Rattus norvegicus]